VGEIQKRDDILQKVATLVNVQLAAEGSEILPFILFTNFDSARHSDKLILLQLGLVRHYLRLL